MTQREIYILGIAAMIGQGTIWYYTGSMAAGWAFLSAAIVLGECVDALARRLDQILRAISGKNVTIADIHKSLD